MPRFLVFSRDDFEKPLECVAVVEEVDDATAQQSAHKGAAADSRLVEMKLVPVDAAYWVVGSPIESGT